MPNTVYQSADSAAQHNKLPNLIFKWDLRPPKPVRNMSDVEDYETKIFALVPYMLENEDVKTAILAMRTEIGKFIDKNYGI